jgi:Rad3-related DNA helicase/DNA polymerase III epsilon subunit-like protein
MTSVRDIVFDHPDGIARPDLLRLVRERINPDATEGQLQVELDELEDDVVEEAGVIRPRATSEPPVVAEPEAPPRGPRRLIAVDLETILRYTQQRPAGERTIFQVGAVRFGPDAAWNGAAAPFDRFVRLEPELAARIVKPDLREQVEALGDDFDAVLADFLEYIAEAEAIVAYNGRSFDFPLLDEVLERRLGERIPPRIRRIDGLYVAIAVWPVPPRRHALSRLINEDRFAAIRQRLEIDLTGLVAHDAADDCRMLAELMRFAAAEVETWPDGLRSLVRSVGRESDAWQMLFELVEVPTDLRPFTVAEVREAISESLAAAGKTPLRPTAAPPPGQLDLSALGDGTRVDIDRLVRAARGEAATPRPSQRDMVEAMRGWLAEGCDALVEAPTGTGKSYAILAVALEWLAADPRNRVVLSTFTRQLQRQLAGDIFTLHEAGVVPGLIGMTSLVKGSANRLSLAGLVRALADSTVPPARRRRGDFIGDRAFAELAIYLGLRFVAKGTPVEEWEAHSVDPVDIEPFFDRYLATRPDGPSRRGLFLRFLSQAETWDYGAGEEAPAEHTSLVKEVLGRNRLLVTNHALLLAHLDDFAEADRTLLVVDEAHALEAAATNALEHHYDHAMVEEALAELRDWIRPLPAGASDEERDRHAHLEAATRQLEWFLDNETLPNLARRALDAAGRDPLHRDALRVVTVAGPTTRPVPPRDGLIRALEEVAKRLDVVAGAIGVEPPRADRLEEQRRHALIDRFAALATGARGVVADLLAIVEPASPTDPPSNRVVSLSEQASRSARPRDFRFEVTSSPIELAREPAYGKLASTFGRLYYISATLRVDASFDFIRGRLDLPAARVREITLPTPFRLEEQARLVAFTDFPSWAEQESAAIRSVAQQVGRLLDEVADGNRNGAMVLTTSRNAANLIYERLIEVRSERGNEYAISSAGYLGTATAVETFKERGGALVGTKGLWQGVDIDAPERLRLVWINKLPFAPFADPLVVARREIVRARAEAEGVPDPDGYAVEHYYLPLAAMELRQAVGRLIRSGSHRGVIVISDRKLAGPTRLHRRYRQVFLGSLEGLVRNDETWGVGGGNLRTMADGWREIWDFLAEDPSVIERARAAELSTPERLDEHVLLPSVRAIRGASLTDAELEELRAAGSAELRAAILDRCATVATHLRDEPTVLHDYQAEAIGHLAEDRDVLAVLPTSYGKSFIFQLPALALPGVTIVVSPLVALMTDQALGLNRSIGGMVRAVVAPMRESNSRTGKAEVADALTNPASRTGIRIVYVSPERLCQLQFQRWIETGVERGIVRRIAIDEAHTFATWGEDFRPSFKRAERFLERLRSHARRPRLIALTATATPAVHARLRRAIFGLDARDPARLGEVRRNPIRPELALYRRMLARGEGGAITKQALLEALVDSVEGHTIIYTLTVKEARAIHAALVEHLGDSERDRVRLFHGRLTSAEKEGVAHDFVTAPREGDEDFRPMIIVATAAFGLGVDRPDIRSVIVASPPADLAALYQELGRAGRDKGAAAGVMLGTPRAFRTLAFMEGLHKTLDPLRVARIAGPILDGTGPLDVEEVARALLDEDVAHGLLDVAEAEKTETLGEFKTAVVRVLAALAEEGLVDDRGDFPDLVRAAPRDDAPVAEAELAALLGAIGRATADPDRVDVVALAAALAPEFPDEAGDPGDLWVRLLELHSLGYLDVSQMPTRRQLTSLVRTGASLPAGFADRFTRRIATEERLRLVSFFSRRPTPTCVNDDFREYFGVPDLPPGTCATDLCRCSGCWLAGRGGPDAVRPRLLATLTDARPRPARLSAGELRGAHGRIARNVERLLRARWGALSVFAIEKTLRGEDHFYSRRSGRMEPLWPDLVNSAVFGVMPALRTADLEAALEALVAADRVRRVGDGQPRYRYAEHVRTEEARAAWAAAKASRDAAAVGATP